MKILHFVILLISICIITSKVNTLFNKDPLSFPSRNNPKTCRPTNWGNQGTGAPSVVPSNSGPSALTNNYEKQYNCLKDTNNSDFNYLLNNYESYCKKNNCSFFVNELSRLANSCVQRGSKCNCKMHKKLYQAKGCIEYIPLCLSQTI